MMQGYTTRKKVVLDGKEDRKNHAMKTMGKMQSFQERLRGMFSAMDAAEEEESGSEKEKKGKKDKKDKKDKKEKDKEEKEDGTFAAIWSEGEEEMDGSWLTGGAGLKFHASGDKAFKWAEQKAQSTKLEIFDPLGAGGNAEVIAEERKKRSLQLQPRSMRDRTKEDGPGGKGGGKYRD